MQIDMHLFGVYALARAAGIKEGKRDKDGNLKWDPVTSTTVKKVKKLPDKAMDCQSYIVVKKDGTHIFYHRENGQWYDTGQWEEKEKKKK